MPEFVIERDVPGARPALRRRNPGNVATFPAGAPRSAQRSDGFTAMLLRTRCIAFTLRRTNRPFATMPGGPASRRTASRLFADLSTLRSIPPSHPGRLRRRSLLRVTWLYLPSTPLPTGSRPERLSQLHCSLQAGLFIARQRSSIRLRMRPAAAANLSAAAASPPAKARLAYPSRTRACLGDAATPKRFQGFAERGARFFRRPSLSSM